MDYSIGIGCASYSHVDDVPMCRVFPFIVTMESVYLHLDYRIMEYCGGVIRGHDFHHSCIKTILEISGCITVERYQRLAKGILVDISICHYKNVTADYFHLNF